MERPEIGLITPVKPANTAPQYFQIGQMLRQNRIDDEERAKKDLEQKKLLQNQAIATKLFQEKGINEESINAYGQITGDFDRTQLMLEKYKANVKAGQDYQNLVTTHQKDLADLNIKRRSITAGFLSGANEMNYPKLRQDLIANGVAKETDLPQQYDQNAIGALIQAYKDPKDLQAMQTAQVDDAANAEIRAETARHNKQVEEETRRHNFAVEAKTPDKSNLSEWEGIDPTTGKPFTAAQASNAKFAISMERGIKNMDKLTKAGFNEADLVNQVVNTFRKKKQLSRSQFLNLARTPEQRRYLQAQLDFMVPHLRDQSGAAINADEYTTEAMQYFPITGDDGETVAQKRAARNEEFISRKVAGGGSYRGMRKAIDEATQSPDEKKLLDDLFPSK